MLPDMTMLNEALNRAFNLPPGVTPGKVSRYSWLDDASSDELWEACSDEQQQKIKDKFISDYAAEVLDDIISVRLTSALRTWETFRDAQVEALARDGAIKG